MLSSFMMRPLIALLLMFLTLTALAGRVGRWTVTFDEAARSFSIRQGNRTILANVVPEAAYITRDGAQQMVSVADLQLRSRSQQGRLLSFEFVGKEGISLQQTFLLNPDHILAQLSLLGADTIESRYLAPLAVRQTFCPFKSPAGTRRMLKVPFDNDDFVRYHHLPFGQQMLSFEAAALYDSDSREGLILGSIDHDHWKSGIQAATATDGSIDSLIAYSGVSHRETRDVLPHGTLRGREIRSARFFIGLFPDWRNGMESFAQANLQVVPRRETWHGSTPIGWQSWGVMAMQNNFQCNIAVSDYFRDVLQPAGFCGEDGRIVMSIDSWDNLSPDQKRELCRHCEAANQVPGTYWTPFSLWWDEARLYRDKLPGQDRYMAIDCTLRVNGKPLQYDGAYCLDPTHPGVHAWLAAEVARIKDYGFRYLKVDFVDNAIIQADSYCDPSVRTAVEAYNQGFTHFLQETDKGEPLFVALSIAPLFPYQYGNSRRMACDTWGRISHAEYSMNALGGGWWAGALYQYLDPDHCPLVGNGDDVHTTEGENRARLSNLCAAGMSLISDNYDLQDKTGKGNPRLSIERAPKVLMNPAVNALARKGKPFRPVYGGASAAADNFFVLNQKDCTYVVVVNYSDAPMEGYLPARDLGRKRVGKAYELWFGTHQPASAQGLHYSVPAKDGRIYRF